MGGKFATTPAECAVIKLKRGIAKPRAVVLARVQQLALLCAPQLHVRLLLATRAVFLINYVVLVTVMCALYEWLEC